MLLGKKRKLGRKIEEISAGEKLTLTEKMEDKDLLLYLGLSGDANPLYIQHDYASLTSFKKPIVPSLMLNGMISSAITKYLPGPGSYISSMEITYSQPVYHYETIQFLFEVIQVDLPASQITIRVNALNEQEQTVLEAAVKVKPPEAIKSMDGHALDNF
ncbi:MaoC/PaaZ C-terminal domain-containing protein [Bacillus testis]|uniref:MaoC/PaaZ C-terminal domain-containing protein n=1 Tax=Bacillus testis TaxID=1622072 RepID=UPI00067EA66D|nr:MaoC/PaaZ C-terminal domain-containing protein [Bacillus testis]